MTAFRRRPIPRSLYRWEPSPKGPSLRYELICNGAAHWVCNVEKG